MLLSNFEESGGGAFFLDFGEDILLSNFEELGVEAFITGFGEDILLSTLKESGGEAFFLGVGEDILLSNFEVLGGEAFFLGFAEGIPSPLSRGFVLLSFLFDVCPIRPKGECKSRSFEVSDRSLTFFSNSNEFVAGIQLAGAFFLPVLAFVVGAFGDVGA
jgi:hypothetical protein